MDEIWKDIEGHEGLFQVSNHGRVRSFKTSKKDGKILKPHLSSFTNDLRITLVSNDKKSYPSIGRLVAEYFIPNPEGLKHINYLDGDATNAHYTNLEWSGKKHAKVYFDKPLTGDMSKYKVGQRLKVIYGSEDSKAIATVRKIMDEWIVADVVYQGNGTQRKTTTTFLECEILGEVK